MYPLVVPPLRDKEAIVLLEDKVEFDAVVTDQVVSLQDALPKARPEIGEGVAPLLANYAVPRQASARDPLVPVPLSL
jgi:hypothetical protein